MKKYRVIMYKAKWFDGHGTDNLIDTWTLLMNLPYVIWEEKLNLKEIWRFVKWCYAHVEIWTPNENSHNDPRPCDWWNGKCWTSTMRDFDDGTTVRPVRDVIKDKSRWDYAEFEANTHEEYRRAIVWATKEVYHNEGYSREDIKKFIPIVRHFVKPNNRNICSEFADKFMVECRNFAEHRLMSPRKEAYLIFKELGKVFKPVDNMLR
jgi:uncharacterized protein YodC (DUF2158 family)